MIRCILVAFLLVLLSSSSFANRSYSAFQVEVSGQGQPLLLIPGATCSGHEWDETVAYYKGKFQFHVFTLAGYAGVSALQNGPYLDSFKTQIESYIRDKQLNHVILIGHSIGGFLSLWIGTDNIVGVEKIVVVDALPYLAIALNPSAKEGFNEAMAKGMFSQYETMSNDQIFQAQLRLVRSLCKDSTHWNQIAGWGASSDKKTMAYTIVEMFGKDLRQSIQSIRVPVLILAAYDANPSSPDNTRENVLKLYTDQYVNCKTCQVDMPEGGTKHFVMYDNPKWYFSELNAFVVKK